VTSFPINPRVAALPPPAVRWCKTSRVENAPLRELSPGTGCLPRRQKMKGSLTRTSMKSISSSKMKPQSVKLIFAARKMWRSKPLARAQGGPREVTRARYMEFARLAAKRGAIIADLFHGDQHRAIPSDSVRMHTLNVVSHPLKPVWLGSSSALALLNAAATYCHHLILEFSRCPSPHSGQGSTTVQGVDRPALQPRGTRWHIAYAVIWGEATAYSAPFTLKRCHSGNQKTTSSFVMLCWRIARGVQQKILR